jgi:hypothetical protein
MIANRRLVVRLQLTHLYGVIAAGGQGQCRESPLLLTDLPGQADHCEN